MIKKLRTRLNDTAFFYGISKSLREAYKLAKFKRSPTGNVRTRVNDHAILLRNNRIDLAVYIATFMAGYHRSPLHLGARPVIVDLGSNIGLTLIDFKIAYPECRLVGVELDPDNFTVLQENTQSISNCQTINAGIWKENGSIFYENLDAQSFKIVEKEGKNTKLMRSITMNTLFNEQNIDRVDYLKMDIEGAEYAVMSENLDWLQKVRMLNIEYHPSQQFVDGYTFLKTILEANGFYVFHCANHWSSLFAFSKPGF